MRQSGLYRALASAALLTGLVFTGLGQATAQHSTQAMTVQEYRQVLVELGGYVDARKNTHLRQQFETIPDEVAQQLLLSTPDPRRLQAAVYALRKDDATEAGSRMRAQAPIQPGAAFPSCLPNTIIDTSTGATCTPAYPDPNNTDWEQLVDPIINYGAFSPTDYPSVSSQACSLTKESHLVNVVEPLNGTVTVAAIGCGALPPIASNVCFGVVAGLGVAGAVFQGFLADCAEQDANINAAEIDAGFHNTVTIYNALGQATQGINTVQTDISSVTTDVLSLTSSLNTDFTSLNTTVNTDFTNLGTTVNTDFTTLNNNLNAATTQIEGQIAAVNANLSALLNQLSTQLTNSTALTTADLRQVMKLELEPDGQRAIVPAILTCTGTNCPNVLNACPAAGCSWNNVGPLP